MKIGNLYLNFLSSDGVVVTSSIFCIEIRLQSVISKMVLAGFSSELVDELSIHLYSFGNVFFHQCPIRFLLKLKIVIFQLYRSDIVNFLSICCVHIA